VLRLSLLSWISQNSGGPIFEYLIILPPTAGALSLMQISTQCAPLIQKISQHHDAAAHVRERTFGMQILSSQLLPLVLANYASRAGLIVIMERMISTRPVGFAKERHAIYNCSGRKNSGVTPCVGRAHA
jgi:hypothetical protein